MRTFLAAAFLTVLCLGMARGDTVTLPDKVQLTGKKIEILEIREDEVLVRVAYGDIVVPRARILSMKVDYIARLARMKEEGMDTPRALFNLAAVCKKLDMVEEARAACTEALQRGSVPEDILLPMAAEFEQAEQWDKARKCYKAYLELRPDAADVQAKAKAATAKAAKVAKK